MRLERLQISGFKSFSDRSELAFDKGVTAIVGPNGCGKSNVADAITWVMGEQSAKSLRGDRMEDVIFGGSDARKPTASAEVRLRLSGVLKIVTAPVFADALAGDDRGIGDGRPDVQGNGSGDGNDGMAADGDSLGRMGEPAVTSLSRADAEDLIRSVAREVEVTRRLYRSGESEYLIDGQACRLRDVHELLMDTGLGAKAYAIIEQGKIGMILGSRPTDRRQLIEEAAGVTKYKSRRRAAELKLEAAQQNLTRIDDIVFEVEKQRGALKRQAAKARRYQKLRDGLRRWEKVLFARKYRQIAETISSVRTRLEEAREREAVAAGRVAEVEADLGRVRIELVEAEAGATRSREAAHALELAINRHQQQIAFDREQAQALEARSTSVAAELDSLEARREPARLALAVRHVAAREAEADRERAAARLAADADAHESAYRNIEGLESDVEAARGELFSAINSSTALRHALEHAATARDRVAEMLSKFDIEAADARIESERVETDRLAAAEALGSAQAAIEATRVGRAAQESALASARIECDRHTRSVRAREQELAGLEARLTSLEELVASRAGFGDAARMVLAEAGEDRIGQLGAVADYLEVEIGYERAVEACVGDQLQHVVVERPEQAADGLRLVRERGAGRCGFLITSLAPAQGPTASGLAPDDPASSADSRAGIPAPEGVAPLTGVVRVTGSFAGAIRQLIGDAWIADSYERAAEVARGSAWPVVTLAGDLFRAPHLVTGGGREEARGILATKREIKELHDRLRIDRGALVQLVEKTATLEATIAHASNAIAALDAEQHRQEKAIVGHELQLQRAVEEAGRLAQKGAQLWRERRQAEEERDALERRQAEARDSIGRLEDEQRVAEGQLASAQRRLFEARESTEELNRRAAEAGAAHAALVERAAAIAADVQRLEEASAEFEQRSGVLAAELEQARSRVAGLREGIAAGEARFAADVRALEALRLEVSSADDAVAAFRITADRHDGVIREARTALDAIRATVSELDIARATAEGDLSHLASVCLEAVQATLDEVMAEVEQLERDGGSVPDAGVICVDEADEAAEEGEGPEQVDLGEPAAAVLAAEQQTLSAEEAISRIRAKIDRLGPVNILAIQQFDELEARHAFLTTQQKDLVESIAQTSQAIRRIDETTRRRFAEAFAVINRNFQETFSTLFGGGRAGLTLLDENDALEGGIEIIAQPPGKRLQNVQLLSGGEKALTAIALMFGLFRFKPSPFCLLDEIDAPLDDANIGRFIEMLRAMQTQTQFILITHNRKTMEIADRLYGVTMEEAGVSKLVSVQLN